MTQPAARQPAPPPAAMPPSLTRHPDLNYAAAEAAEQRTRVDGPWSVDHLRLCWIVLVPIGIALSVAAGFAAGPRAVAGSVTGIVIVGAFFTLSALIVAWIGSRAPEMVLAAALGAYVLKIAALGVVVMLLPPDGPIAPRWMAIAVVVGLVTWMATHLRFIWTAKLLYTDPLAAATTDSQNATDGGDS